MLQSGLVPMASLLHHPRYRTAGFGLSGDFLAVGAETSTPCTPSRPLWGLSLDVELPRRSEPKPTLCRLKWSGHRARKQQPSPRVRE